MSLSQTTRKQELKKKKERVRIMYFGGLPWRWSMHALYNPTW
jgi:hypothetical protein